MLSLEKLLDGLDVEVEPFAVCEVRGRGALDMGRHQKAMIHYTLAGTGLVKAPGHPAIEVAPGTVLIIPAGMPHRLESSSRSPESTPELPRCAPLETGWTRLQDGTGSHGVLLACSTIQATYQLSHGLFDYVTEPIVEQFAAQDRIRRALGELLDELARPQPGTRILARSLMEQCLVLLLRRHCTSGDCRAPWLRALEDPRLGRVVAAMFEHPEAPYSLEQLADLAGMSRSSFAEHFAAEFGRAPMDLLKEIRMRRAARLLVSTDDPVKLLAGRVGYASRSYFSRAFKDFYKMSPAEYRVNQASSEDRPEGR